LNIYLIIPLVEIIFCAGLMALLILKGRHHIARKPFAFYLGFMAVWGTAIYLMRYSADLTVAAFWERFVFGAIVSAAICFYWFTVTLTGTKLNKKILYPFLIAYVLILCLIPTNLVFSGMQSMWYGKAPVIGPLFPLYVFCVYVPIAFGMVMLIKNARKTKSNDEKTRNEYIIAGVILMFIGGTTDYLPVLGVGIYPLGIIGNILFCVLATIAMLKYGLLEIQVVLRKGAAYSLISIFIFGIFGSIILILTTVFQNNLSPISMAITITAVFLIAAIFQPFMTKLQKIVDRWFFRQRYDYLEDLKNFSQDKEGDLDLSQLSASLVTIVANSMQSNGVYLLLPSATNKEYVTKAFNGQKNQVSLAFPLTAPLVITLKYQDRIVDSSDMDIIPALSSLAENDRKLLDDCNIELLMPLKNEKRLVGILLLGRKLTREPYSNEDRQLLQSLSNDIAIRIDNASRFDSIKNEHNELQKTMDGVIYTISAVIESRDPYTAGHQRRVAELARAIAKEMGLSEWHQKGMHIIGLLHDVGKIAVPAEILSKPGKISQFEFNIIKNHPQTGYEILEKIDFPWPIAKAILQHHERVDGSGYPNGLNDGQIIMEAKIIGVADVVEAMSSHRPYRPALGLDSALKEISQKSGILYDRDVVDACLRLLNNSQFAFENLMSAADSPKVPVLTK
jgi:putative nucleotidyltransferase with HDIG domain